MPGVDRIGTSPGRVLILATQAPSRIELLLNGRDKAWLECLVIDCLQID